MIVSELGCWYNIVGCRSIKGRKDIMDIVQRSIQQCERYSPSILILDDVDSLVPAEVEGTSHQDAHYYDTLVLITVILIFQHIKDHKI